MLSKIIKTADSSSEKELTFEIGSNSDLILENTITGNLPWTIQNFAKSKHGFLTFPTKFDMIDPIIGISGIEKVKFIIINELRRVEDQQTVARDQF